MLDVMVFLIFPMALFALSYQMALRHIVKYRITEYGIDTGWWGHRLIPFDDIADIRRISYLDSLGKGLAYWRINRAWGDMVLITRRRSERNEVIVTPDDADGFVQEVRRRLPDYGL